METKKSKYDTNPLDPDFAKQTEEVWSDSGGGSKTQEVQGDTQKLRGQVDENPRSNIYSEAPTRRYDNVNIDSPYPSVFVPPTYSQPAPQPPRTAYQPVSQKLTSRSVAGIGLPEKWAMMLPYAPAYIGVVVSLLELFLVPRREAKLRFHAAQGLALHTTILVVQTLFGVIGAITDFSIGGKLFSAAATVFLIISMIRVWKGEAHYIAPLNEPTNWFNEHIEPRNKS